MNTVAESKMMVPLDQIKIDRTRFRAAEPKDVESTAASMKTFGQLQPIIIEATGELLDGLHRFEAAKKNGWTELWATYRQDVDELLAREIELETNIRRKQMTWKEEQQAIVEIDKLKRKHNPNWGATQTAQVAGVRGASAVSEAKLLVNMMQAFPEIAGAKSKHQALSWAKAKSSNIIRKLEVKANPQVYQDIEEKIWLGDSVELIKLVPDESFRAIVTDPPFGLNYGARKSNMDQTMTAYEDGEENYERLLTMAPDLYRVLKPDGWLTWFFGMSWYERVKEVFSDAGFTVDELPVVWNRSGGKCHTNRPDRYYSRSYDVALHCFKGEPEIVRRNRPNVITVDPVSTSEREALVERPVQLYKEIIERLTVPGETVADFFVGSGSCPAAAASCGRDYFGIEQNPDRRAIAIKKIRAHTPTTGE